MPTFTNRATLTYNNESINSNTVVGEIVEVLEVTKTAVGTEYSPGDTVAYAIGIVNSGNTPFQGLTLTDDLGAYTFGTRTLYPLTYVEGSIIYYVNGELRPSPAVLAGPPLTVSGISVPARGNATLVYSAAVNTFAPSDTGSIITNTVTLEGDGVGENVSDAETVTVSEGADLTITKSLSPDTVAQNAPLTYTFTIENTGNAPAAGTVVVTDTFDPVLSDIAVTFNGQSQTSPDSYIYNEQTGEFATVPGAITVPAATFVQDLETGIWSTSPGVFVITVTGTV